jgi:serine/threonine protein kinase
MTGDPRGQQPLEAQRVFAKVARAMLGADVALPTIGRFEVHERLGTGGMGEVYGAWDPQAEREVAIKVLRSDRSTDAAARRRMQREARALVRLDHPNVVRIHEVGESDDRVYLAMELLRGETMAQCLEREQRLSVARTFEMISGVCAGLQHAHDVGIIHRDLKPGNVLLLEEGAGATVKVLDFGLAKIVASGTLDLSTASGTVMGTLHYMSPEQARDSTKLDHRGDLWSVAVIAYECLVGERPFEADTMAELAVRLLTGMAPVPSEHGSVPAGFDAWFRRATARDLDARFTSANELLVGFGEALGQAVPAVRARSPRRPRWPLGTAAAAAGVLGVVWVWWPSSTESPSSSSAGTAARSEPPPEASPQTAALPPAAPDTIVLRLRVTPPDATVWIDGERVDPGRASIALPRTTAPRRVRASAPGFETMERVVVPDRAQTVVLELPAASVPSPPTEPAPRRREPTPKVDVDDLEL